MCGDQLSQNQEGMMEARGQENGGRRFMFWTCFVSLVATSFGFISRAFLLGDWGTAFNLSETQLGEIFGAGLWPFAISIVVFSLVLDKVGDRNGLWFAFACHIASAVMTIMATGYQSLYWAAFVGALGNGAVEAVINPAVATAYPKEKTKWLNILHAGWPCGLAIAGALTIVLGGVHWKVKAALIFIPSIAYGIMLLRCHFPVNERVAAGVSYRDMLKEPGGIGIGIVATLIICELGRVFAAMAGQPTPWTGLIIASIVVAIAYGLYVKSLGRPMYIFMLLVMLLLATTELGTDGWIKELMGPAMELIGLNSGWILVYTATLMMILRFLTGPIMRTTRLSPLGLLAVSCVMVIIGIITLSKISTQAGLLILIASTIYGAGQCFFWPTTLGFIAERFPKGGALTLNAIGGVGMLGVGILGGPWLGYIQNTTIETQLAETAPAIHQQITGEEMESLFGTYKPIDEARITAHAETLPSDEAREAFTGKIDEVRGQAKRDALFKVSVLPLIMLICYIGLILYFRMKGGYQAVDLGEEAKQS
jgi:MFS family permease